MPKLLFVVTVDWYFCSHRLGLARAARAQGLDVAVATSLGGFADRIREAGIQAIPVNVSRRGLNALGDLAYVVDLVRIYRSERPDIVHHVALKPVVYGSLAARLAGVSRVVNAVAGLGFLYASSSWQARLLRPFVRQAFRWLLGGPRSWTIVQNPDDRAVLSATARLEPSRVRLIRGAGVDLHDFHQRPEPEGRPVVMLASRMIREKGVEVLVDAARLLKQRQVDAGFWIVGAPDPGNPATINEAHLRAWQAEGIVEWLGQRSDIARLLGEAHIACLPSFYGEGVPKYLLEALAAGRPVVTTDMPGCREVVIDGENGFLVPPRDPVALADALEKLIGDQDLRRRFGVRSRALAEAEFGTEKVNEATLMLYREMLRY